LHSVIKSILRWCEKQNSENSVVVMMHVFCGYVDVSEMHAVLSRAGCSRDYMNFGCSAYPSVVLTLLVEKQEGYLACKKYHQFSFDVSGSNSRKTGLDFYAIKCYAVSQLTQLCLSRT